MSACARRQSPWLVFSARARLRRSALYTVNPLTVNALSTGLSASISVIAGTSCTWTATSPDSWITVAGGSHAGIGSVNYTVAANSTSAARTGTIVVAGQTVTVTQAFGSCNATVNPLTVNALSTGLSASISVIAGTSCTWTATSPDSWITVAGGSHAGIGSVNYTVAVNSTSAARTGTMTVAGKTVTVNQAFGSCNFTVTPLVANVPSTPFSGSVSVIAGSSCAWTATSPDSWITVAGGSHTGIGSVNYTVAANSTAVARTGSMAVAGRTVTVNQAASSCVYTVSPTSSSVPLSGFINASVSVITGFELRVDGDELGGLDHDHERGERDRPGIGDLHRRAGKRATDRHAHGRRPDHPRARRGPERRPTLQTASASSADTIDRPGRIRQGPRVCGALFDERVYRGWMLI